MRVSHPAYQALPLRAHEFLAGVPLHDVWRFRLNGGDPNLTVAHVADRFIEVVGAAAGTREGTGAGLVVRALFGLRSVMGRAFGWDQKPASVGSYLDRLTPDDRQRSLEKPGSSRAFWTTLYTFEQEALGEVINRTVHAFLLFYLEPSPVGQGTGYALTWAIYVKPVSRLTPVYMALIDPFRRWFVYPALVRRFEEAWREGNRET